MARKHFKVTKILAPAEQKIPIPQRLHPEKAHLTRSFPLKPH